MAITVSAPKVRATLASAQGRVNGVNAAPMSAWLICACLARTPTPRWRHQLRSTWSLPGNADISLNWRHIGALQSELGSAFSHLQGTVFPVDAKIAAYDYFDLAGSVDLTKNYTLRV